MHHPPLVSYSGLTIVMSKPSRFDKTILLSGMAGQYFEQQLHPVSRSSVDIITVDKYVELRPGTKVVLLLGEESLRLYPNESKDITLNDARGNPIRDNSGVVYIPTFAPQDSFDRRDYESTEDSEEGGEEDTKGHGTTKRKNWRWWMTADVKKAIRLLKRGGEYPSDEQTDFFQLQIEPDIEDAIKILNSTSGQVLFTDIETTHGQVLTCIGFNFSNSPFIYVIPWKKYTNTLAYDRGLCYRFLQALAIAFGRNRVVCHNSMFDLLVLCFKYRIPPPSDIYDTMVVWQRCHPELEKSLGHLISYFLHQPYHKSEGVYHPRNHQQEQQLYRYNAKDIITMRMIYYHLLEEVKKFGAEKSAETANRLIRPYLKLTLGGIRLDKEKFLSRFDRLDFTRTQINRCIEKVVGIPDFNPRSWQQVGGYLYEGLKLPCPNPDEPTNSKTLLRLLTKHEVPSVKLILLGRKVAKTASSMKYRQWPEDITNPYENYSRFTTGYNIAGTETFRLSSRSIFKYKRGTESDKKGFGSNGQNWDKDQRDLVISDIGYKLGQVDQAGAEALIVSYLCRAGKFRDLFLNGVKPHVFVGLHVFKDEWKRRIKNPTVIDQLCSLAPRFLKSHEGFEEVKNLIASSDNWGAKERFYFIAKMICHASNYSMKAPTFQTNVLEKSEGAIVLELGTCRLFLQLYHTFFPEIQLWHYDVRQEVSRTRTLKNLFGEPRHFVAPFDDELWKQCYAFVPQSTVGQITNLAIMEMQESIDKGNHRDIGLEILQNGHDSILFQFLDLEGNDKKAIEVVKSFMNRELTSPRGEIFKMKTEAQVGYNWKPFKKTYNERGLVEVK